MKPKITVSQVRNLLRKLAFDPRKPGHLKPVIDVGNPDYYLTRSAEMVLEARSFDTGTEVRRNNIENAITLLSLALHYETPEEQFEGTLGS